VRHGASSDLLRAVHAEIVPALLRRRAPEIRPAPCSPVRPPGGGSGAHEFDEEAAFLAGLLINEDKDAAAAFVARLTDAGLPLETVYLELLQPAARYIGTLWEEDLCGFGDVTLATHRLLDLLRDLAPAYLGADGDGTDPAIRRDDERRRLLLMVPPGEQHMVGTVMLADIFRKAGWSVVRAAPGGFDEMEALARAHPGSLIGLSAGCGIHAGLTGDCVRRLRGVARDTCPAILVGGPLFLSDPGLALRLGADLTAPDGREALRLAERVLE
jgi:methylmalonyl-CoA mutase cobalamin-binding subunit